MGNVSFNTSNSSISQLSSPCLLKMIPSQQLSRQSAISTPMLRSRAIAKETLQPTPASDRATKKFPGASVTIGSAASGVGDNREIPVEEGGSIGKHGQPTKARDFEGEGGPEDKAEKVRRDRGGEDGV